MKTDQIKHAISAGKTSLGIELGSTRIKAVLIGEDFVPIASGSHAWENRQKDGVWTYSQDEICAGLQSSYRDLAADVRGKYDTELTSVGAIGISAMMHGYLAFDKNGQLLVPFRTWRNTITGQAAEILTEQFHFNIPQRWSIAHLYQAILNGEPHVKDIAYLTTLAGYVHWLLTGRKVLGIGDASGMFPINSTTGTYDQAMMRKFDDLIGEKKFCWGIEDILPRVLPAGEQAGMLTESGASLLDPTGTLQAGIPFCPPEGDAGTGMVATNSVAVHTGNVSAGTSIFAMIVLKKPLSGIHPEIDLVTTPSGAAVAMIHCNNCTSDIDAWAKLFQEFTAHLGIESDIGAVFGTLYSAAVAGAPDCGGLLSYNYLSGEPVTGMENGCPLLLRPLQSEFTLANFMRMNLYSTLSTLKIGLDILVQQEQVQLDHICGHGGLFKRSCAGQQFLADAIGVPVSVMSTAGEGGAWGMALLAAYLHSHAEGESLEMFLADCVYANAEGTQLGPNPDGAAGFQAYMKRYVNCLPIEKAAAKLLGSSGE
ncbi:MAG: ATPase [Ruminococcaceae bacterium]|nr:ATPase [Oscillospiraceae bacterium]